MKSLALTLGMALFPFFLSAQILDSLPINQIYKSVPEGLAEAELLIPRYDFLDPEDGAVGTRRDFIVRFNRQAKKSNTTLNDIIRHAYPYKYKMVGLRQVEAYAAQGYRYFLDMVLMPKQMEEVKAEAMIPSFIRYEGLAKMFRNRYTQFHYYFYIRDLETDDAYVGTKLRGDVDGYNAMKKFLRQAKKDSLN